MKLVNKNADRTEKNLKLPKEKEAVPPLEILLKDPEVASFYRLIHEYDFRTKALDLLESRLAKLH